MGIRGARKAGVCVRWPLSHKTPPKINGWARLGSGTVESRLGIPIPTAKSWARRGKWNLPRRKGGGRPKAYPVSSPHPVADALDASREELLDTASTAILRSIAKTATEAAKKGALDVATVSELSQLATALARARGDKSEVNVAVNNQVGVVITEAKLQELRERLRRLQEQEETEENALPAEAASTPIATDRNAARGQRRRWKRSFWHAYSDADHDLAKHESFRL